MSWIRIEGKTIEEVNKQIPKLSVNESVFLKPITFNIKEGIYYTEYQIREQKEQLSELDKLKIGIHEIKQLLIERHNNSIYKDKIYCSHLLKEMFELGIITEYSLQYGSYNNKYKIRYYDNNKKEKIRVD
jgi:hypothetical protein